MNELSNLKAPKGATHKRKRLGRGIGSRLGKTAGRGHGGMGQRKSGNVGAWFEGGQMPLQRRLPKVGFTNIFRKEYATVNVSELAAFEAGTRIDEAVLRGAGLVKGKNDGLKILGNGDLTVSLHIVADKFTSGAKSKIEAAGGTAEVIGG
ncbi:MAG TPA: 50S ribosomal protein L15 [Myxococcales bacterium]|nr:50S ribosomal protein L15 [Myxococcales bacterium]HAN32125.1 50S ribosomal protein L15 [Myxococcales bacterium]